MKPLLSALGFALLSTISVVFAVAASPSTSCATAAAKFFEMKHPVVKKAYIYVEHEYLKSNPSAVRISDDQFTLLVHTVNSSKNMVKVNEAVPIISKKLETLLKIFSGAKVDTLLYIAADAFKYQSLIKYLKEKLLSAPATQSEVNASLRTIIFTQNSRLFGTHEAFTPDVMTELINHFKPFFEKAKIISQLTEEEVATIFREKNLKTSTDQKEQKFTIATEVSLKDLQPYNKSVSSINGGSSSSSSNFMFYLVVGFSVWIILAVMAYFVIQRLRKPAAKIPCIDSEKLGDKIAGQEGALDKDSKL